MEVEGAPGISRDGLPTAEAFNAALEAVGQGDLVAARAALETVLSQDPADTEAVVMLAQVDRDAGDTEAARRRLSAFAEADPEAIDVRIELADLELEAGDPAAAATVLRQVLTIKPHHWEGQHLLGRAFAEAEAWEEAIRAYQGALESNPFSGDVWYDMGRACLELGDPTAAAAAWKAYLRSAPDAEDRAEVEAAIAHLEATA